MRNLRTSRQRGQALVEFALILPVMAVITFGMIEFGFMLNNHAAVVTSARDGARVAAVKCSPETQTSCATKFVNQAVADSTDHLLGCSKPTNTGAGTTVTGNPVNPVGGPPWSSWTVKVTCTYSPLTPWGTLYGPAGGVISGTATFRDSTCVPPGCSG